MTTVAIACCLVLAAILATPDNAAPGALVALALAVFVELATLNRIRNRRSP